MTVVYTSFRKDKITNHKGGIYLMGLGQAKSCDMV